MQGVVVEAQQWLQIETLTALLTNELITSHIPLAQLHVVFENEHGFFVPKDGFSIHQWYFLLRRR